MISRRWIFRYGTSACHIDRRYGVYIGRENFGDMGEHYSYPRYRFGIYLCWGQKTCFIGLSNEKKGSA
jgi:hypothetical protein